MEKMREMKKYSPFSDDYICARLQSKLFLKSIILGLEFQGEMAEF